jgi:transcriptional regulator with XRE-family HTH domain
MAKKKTKFEPLGDQVRRAVTESGLTYYRVSKESGIEPSALTRFMSGKVGLSLDSLERIGRLLDLRVERGPHSATPADFADARFKTTKRKGR